VSKDLMGEQDFSGSTGSFHLTYGTSLYTLYRQDLQLSRADAWLFALRRACAGVELLQPDWTNQ